MLNKRIRVLFNIIPLEYYEKVEDEDEEDEEDEDEDEDEIEEREVGKSTIPPTTNIPEENKDDEEDLIDSSDVSTNYLMIQKKRLIIFCVRLMMINQVIR